MKKVIIASLVFLMIGAAAVYADSTSFIGRKIQSEAVVTLDGKEIGSVLIIDGVSYAPVRVIAEASGLSAGYKKGEVMLTTNTVETASTTESIDVDSLTKEKRLLEIQADTLRNYIRDLTRSISEYEDAVEKANEQIAASYRTMISDAEGSRTQYETELAAAEQRIAEIDKLLK